jgi:hypothetical protein
LTVLTFNPFLLCYLAECVIAQMAFVGLWVAILKGFCGAATDCGFRDMTLSRWQNCLDCLSLSLSKWHLIVT